MDAGDTGACGGGVMRLGETRGRVGGMQGVEWRTLGRSGGSGACWSGGAVAGRACMQCARQWAWPADHRRLRPGEGALVLRVGLGCFRETRATSWTCWFMPLVVAISMAWTCPSTMATCPTSSKPVGHHVLELALASLNHPMSTPRTRAPSPGRNRRCSVCRHAVEQPAGTPAPPPPRPTNTLPSRPTAPAHARAPAPCRTPPSPSSHPPSSPRL